jgi:Phosphoenolpyruvate phosphomutase
MTADLKAHADRLRELHHGGEMLVLPNVWDAASAKIVAEAGFPVVATASAAISAMLGYPDGEGAPWQEMFAAAGRVARAVSVPVTVDARRDTAWSRGTWWTGCWRSARSAATLRTPTTVRADWSTPGARRAAGGNPGRRGRRRGPDRHQRARRHLPASIRGARGGAGGRSRRGEHPGARVSVAEMLISEACQNRGSPRMTSDTRGE